MIWPSCWISGPSCWIEVRRRRRRRISLLSVLTYFPASGCRARQAPPCLIEIESFDSALGNGACHQIRVGGIADRHIGRVARLSRHLQAGIVARAGSPMFASGRVLPRLPCQISSAAACCSARIKVRLPSSILNALCSWPFAPANATSAAASAVSRGRSSSRSRRPQPRSRAKAPWPRRRARCGRCGPCRPAGRARPRRRPARTRRIGGRASSDTANGASTARRER